MSEQNGNGHGNLTRARLDKLLAYHESAALAIRTTLQLLDGAVERVTHAKTPSVLAEAIGLDKARRAHKATSRPVGRPRKDVPPFVAKRKLHRAKTGTLLATISRTDPVAAVGRVTGILLKSGYIARKGDGYVRTAKEFVP